MTFMYLARSFFFSTSVCVIKKSHERKAHENFFLCTAPGGEGSIFLKLDQTSCRSLKIAFLSLMFWWYEKKVLGKSKIAVRKTPFSPGKLRWEEIWDCQGLSKKREGLLPDIVRRRKGCARGDVPAPPSRAAFAWSVLITFVEARPSVFRKKKMRTTHIHPSLAETSPRFSGPV